jgi:nitrogen fixation protein FixH
MSTAIMRETKPRGSWIPWLFVAFFLVVIAANGAMIWFATESWTGLSTKDPYDKGLAYNRNLEAAQRQAVLGWRPSLEARVVSGFSAEAELSLEDAQGAPLTGAEVVASFERPLEARSDFEVALEPVRPGVYGASFELPRTGLWVAHVRIRRGQDLYVHEERLVLR